MMRGLVTRGLQVTIAAALMRAGVAVACPPPPLLCPEQQPDPSELYACTSDVPVVDTGLVVTIWARHADSGRPIEARQVGDEYVVAVPGPSGSVNRCDSLARFTVDDVTVGLSEPPGDGVAPEFTDVRVVQVTNANTSSESFPSSTGMRYGSGAFCLWAAEAGTDWDRRYEVTVQAWDAAHHVLYQGVAKIRIECGAVGPGDTSLPADRIFYQDSCTDNPASDQCFVEIPVPAGVCEPAPPDGGGDDGDDGGDGGCIPSEGHGCGDDGDTGGGDTGDTGGTDSGDDGSECVPVEGHGCGTPAGGVASSAASSPNAGSEATSGSDDSSIGTTPRVGCSAFPYADPSLGALVLLGLGLLRRRRSS